MARAQRILTALAALVAALLALGVSAATSASADAGEAEFVGHANAARAAHGVGPLTVAEDLVAVARAHSQRMAGAGTIFHNSDLGGHVAGWQVVGENVGRGGSAGSLHEAFMNSPAHRQNVLDARFTQVGIGTVIVNGTIFVTQVFRLPEAGFAAAPPAGAAPIGTVDIAHRVPGGVRVAGWTLDPDTAESTSVHVYVDGRFAAAVGANRNRGDIAAAFPGYGPAHGYESIVPAGEGVHQVCAYAINLGPAGGHPIIGCSTVGVSTAPIGSLDLVQRVAGGVRVAGWTLDADTAASTSVHVYVDGRFATAYAASGNRADIGAAFPGYGAAHGYETVLPVGGGAHTVCAYAINLEAGTVNPGLGCATA